jgi:hypothetical protein
MTVLSPSFPDRVNDSRRQESREGKGDPPSGDSRVAADIYDGGQWLKARLNGATIDREVILRRFFRRDVIRSGFIAMEI